MSQGATWPVLPRASTRRPHPVHHPGWALEAASWPSYPGRPQCWLSRVHGPFSAAQAIWDLLSFPPVHSFSLRAPPPRSRQSVAPLPLALGSLCLPLTPYRMLLTLTPTGCLRPGLLSGAPHACPTTAGSPSLISSPKAHSGHSQDPICWLSVMPFHPASASGRDPWIP